MLNFAYLVTDNCSGMDIIEVERFETLKIGEEAWDARYGVEWRSQLGHEL